MAIKIKDAAEFSRLLEAIANELVDANIYLKLHYDLIAATEEFSKEFRQSWTFWSLTLQAHLDAAVFRLCKIYDQDHRSLNLRTFLEVIKENVSVFHEKAFRERLRDNPFVESLAADAREPDPQQLEADLSLASTKNPLVQRLVQLRNNFYAHRGAKDVIAANDIGVKYPLSKDEVKELLGAGMTIVNRYSGLFRAQTYSTQMVGRDDYRYVLGVVREDLKRRERELEDELRRYTIRDA